MGGISQVERYQAKIRVLESRIERAYSERDALRKRVEELEDLVRHYLRS